MSSKCPRNFANSAFLKFQNYVVNSALFNKFSDVIPGSTVLLWSSATTIGLDPMFLLRAIASLLLL
jgi:hypothetical protein